MSLNSKAEVGSWGRNPGTPISRLAGSRTPFRRMAFPGSPPSGAKFTCSGQLDWMSRRIFTSNAHEYFSAIKRPKGREDQQDKKHGKAERRILRICVRNEKVVVQPPVKGLPAAAGPNKFKVDAGLRNDCRKRIGQDRIHPEDQE